jgi:hypothetical protein
LVLTLVGMSKEEYARGPFWAMLPRAPGARPLVLGVADRTEPQDYPKFCAKHGAFFQFFLLNDDAVAACNAAHIKLTPLGAIDYDDLMDRPSVLLDTGSPRPI